MIKKLWDMVRGYWRWIVGLFVPFVLIALLFVQEYNVLEKKAPPESIISSLEGLNATERANLKAKEISKINYIPKTNVQNYWVEITDIKTIPLGVEFYARAWDKQGNQIGFGKDGSVEWEKFRIFNPPILVVDPMGDIVRRERKLKEDLKEALLQTLEHTISVISKDKPRGKIVKGKVGQTTSTFIPIQGNNAPWDGRVMRGHNVPGEETFSVIRAGAGTSCSAFEDTIRPALIVNDGAATNKFNFLIRGIFGFNTASIPDTDNIDSATFSAKGESPGQQLTGLGNTDVDLVSASGVANTSDCTVSDYQNAFGTTRFATGKAITTIVSDTFNNWVMNASGRAAINKTGFTFLGLRLKWDVDNNFTGTWANYAQTRASFWSADEAGTASDPKLVVEHTAPSVIEDLFEVIIISEAIKETRQTVYV